MDFIETNYDIDVRNIVKDYLNYVIHKNDGIIQSDFLDFCEFTPIYKIQMLIILKITFFQK